MVHRNVESVYFLLSFGLKTTKQNLLRDSQIILWVTHQGDVILLQEFLQLLQMSFVRMACSVYFTAMNYVGIPLNKSHFRQATLLGFQRSNDIPFGFLDIEEAALLIRITLYTIPQLQDILIKSFIFFFISSSCKLVRIICFCDYFLHTAVLVYSNTK